MILRNNTDGDSKIIIRNYCEKDQDSLNEVINTYDAERYLRVFPTEVNKFIPDSKYDIVLIAESLTGEFYGFIKLSFDGGNFATAVDYIYVKNKVRRFRIANDLLDAGVNYAKKRFKTDMLFVETIQNAAMVKFLLAKGFKLNGTYKDSAYYNGERLDSSFFVKQI